MTGRPRPEYEHEAPPSATATGSRTPRRIVIAGGAAAAAGGLLELAGLPAGWLVGGLAAGVVLAIRWGEAVPLPRPLMLAAEAAIGVMLGALLDLDAFAPLAGAWPAVIAVVLATLGLSVGAGLLLGRRTGLDRPTAALGMVAGAAPGVVAASRELGADTRLVALMQFGRVTLILLTAPPLALALGDGAGHGGGATGLASAAGADPAAGLIACACALVGGVLGAASPLPAGGLLVPLALAAGVTVAGGDVALPTPLAVAALTALGLGIGLQFDRATVGRARRLALAALGGIVAVIAGCAALAVGLGLAAGLDPLTAYLATTPGGLSTVLATASDTGAQTTIVLAVQTLRLLLMVAAAPFLGALGRA